MDYSRDDAREIARGQIEPYLQSRGINTRKHFHCLNPGHSDSNPSMSLDRKHNRVKCFACGASYDVFDLVAIEYGLTDQREIFDKTYQVLGIDVKGTNQRATAAEDFSGMGGQNQDKSGQTAQTDVQTDAHTHKQEEKPERDYTAYYEACKKRLPETDYRRGLSNETLERHYIGFDPCFKTKDHDGNFAQWRALIIPTGKGSYAARNTAPEAHKKDRYRKRGAAQIFAYKTLQTALTPIFVVEGEIDAMSIEEAGGAAIGLGSYDNVPLLLKLLETKKPSQPLIIAFDDEAEPDKQKRVEEAEKKLSDGLERLQIPFYRLHPYGAFHDANEALMMDKEAFTEAIAGAANIEKQAEEEERSSYLSTNTANYLQQFVNGIEASVNTEAIPTGFKTLDEVLEGGFYEGLHTVGAISSLGKTTLIMQMADKVAESGRDVLIFSLEMARSELMSKSISRHTLDKCIEYGYDMSNAKTARGITDGKRYVNYNSKECKLIEDAIKAYGAYAEHLYIQEGVGDIGVTEIRETIEKHIRFTGRRPLCIVDYIQILAPYNERATDKQNTDKAVLELKRITRDYKVPLIAISAFNRNSYKAEAMFEALKESGSIEYTSDTVIGLQLKGAGRKDFNPTEEKKREPRQIELVILKNRQGKVGDKIFMEYYPKFNYFRDRGLSS